MSNSINQALNKRQLIYQIERIVFSLSELDNYLERILSVNYDKRYLYIFGELVDAGEWKIYWSNKEANFHIGYVNALQFGKRTILRFYAPRLMDGFSDLQGTIGMKGELIRDYAKSIESDLIKMGKLETEDDEKLSKARGMSEWRKKRAHLFKRKKDENPDFCQEDIANEVQNDVTTEIKRALKNSHPKWNEEKLDSEATLKFGEEYHKPYFTEHDVRNDYRDIGWEWKRGDRKR